MPYLVEPGKKAISAVCLVVLFEPIEIVVNYLIANGVSGKHIVVPGYLLSHMFLNLHIIKYWREVGLV